MRKIFSLIAAVLFAGSMMATEVTVSKTVEELATANSWANGTVVTPFALDEVITVSTNATDVNTGKYYTSGQQVRLYQSGAAELIISAAEGYTISSITLTYSSQNTGIFVEAESGVAVDFENVQSATFTVGNSGEATNGQARVTAISVTYNGEGGVTPPAPAVATPVISGEETFTESVIVTITCATPEADIYYTIDGTTDPKCDCAAAPEYTQQIVLTETTTIMAAAYTGNDWSAVATKTFTKVEPLADPTNCAEAAAAALSVSANNELYNNGAVYTIEGYVTGIKTAYSDEYHNISFWMADAADGGEVLQAYRAACASEADAPKVGDKVQVTGSLTKYGTTPEFAAGCTYVITEPYIPVEPTINYYVAGSMGVWGPDEAYKLTPSNNGEYEGEFTFAANDEFKVIGYDGTTVTWFPEGMNNNYVITEAGDYKITFNPAGNVEGWYEGFFNVVKKEAPIVHQYEVAEAIAAGLTDDTEILVRGVITKMEFKGKNFAKYGSVNIYVADATDAEGEFEFYNCYSLNADTFRTSIPNYDPESTSWAQFNEVADENGNTIHVGDTVIAFGKYKLYNSTHELNTGCYLVDIKHAPVAPADTIVIDIEDEVEYTDYVAAQGWWQFMAETEDYEISLSNISTTQAAGVYTVADMDQDYTYIYIKATEAEVHFVDGEFTLTEAEDGSRTIEGIMTGDDGNIYNIKIVYHIPTAKTTVNVEIPEWGIVDASEYYGFAGYILAGETADKNIYVQITIPGNNPLGTFSYDDLYPGGTGIEVAGDYKGIYSMNITVTAGGTAGAERAFVTADILCYNNTLYHVTTLVGEGVDAIEAAEQAVKAIVNGQVVVKKAGKTFNMNGAVIR